MPTNKWFQENPKISAYISKNLYERLEEWMESRGTKKISQALTQILEEHLEVAQVIPNQSTVNQNRLEVLEGK